MIGSFIFFIEFFNEYIRYLVNRSSIFTLNIGPEGPEPEYLSLLPTDCISEIVERLHSFEDVVAVSKVSQTLLSACFDTTFTRPHQLPWLMHSETPDTDRRLFSSLLNGNLYELPQSEELCGKRCWGSQHNWVVALGSDYRAHLVPLGKGKPIALPPLDTIRGDAPEEWFRLVNKFILFKDPSASHDREQSFLVFAIYSPMNRLAFARVGEGAALNRSGQDEWVIVTSPDNLEFKDVARLNNEVYGLCNEGTLVRFDLGAPLAQVIASHQPEVPDPRKLYLVESLGKLYMVFRYGDLIPSQRRHVTTLFLVYMYNFSAQAFEGVTDFEGHAFFVGDGNSWSAPASTIPGITNRIHFTDDYWDWADWPMYLGGEHGGPPLHSRPIHVTPPIRLG